MSAAWTTVGALCLGTAALKASGPVVLRGRRPPERALAVIALVAPVLLTALVLYQTLGGHPDGIEVDARIVGLAVAGGAIALRLPMIAVVTLAAAATALARLIA